MGRQDKGGTVMDTVELNGSVIKVKRWHGVYYHYGIYVKKPFIHASVIHYTNEGSDFNGIVRETSLEDFLQGESGFSVCFFSPTRYPHIYSGAETVRRARSKLGNGDYNLVFNNCEHFATWCKTGERSSSQCNAAIKKLSVFAIFGVGGAVLEGVLGGSLGGLLGRLGRV